VISSSCWNTGIKTEQLHCDGWSIGIDKRFPQSQRLQQCIVSDGDGDGDGQHLKIIKPTDVGLEFSDVCAAQRA
jgi:hypothetical protein